MKEIIKLLACIFIYGFITMSTESSVTISDIEDTKKLIEFKEIKGPPHVNDFIKRWHKIAQLEDQKFGVKASIKLAQAAKESGWSKDPKGNAFFGIKCNDCKDYVNRKEGKFAAFKSAWSSWRHHSLFLQADRYKSCFECKTYQCWAKQLKVNGYAEDIFYDKGLIEIIEDYGLQRYDQ